MFQWQNGLMFVNSESDLILYKCWYFAKSAKMFTPVNTSWSKPISQLT